MDRKWYDFSPTQDEFDTEDSQQELDKSVIMQWNKRHQKEQEPEYKLTGLKFNEYSRIAHICFQKETLRRNIVKYEQRNYQKRPIYGKWKAKTTNIKKTLKLTNEVLESLWENDDELIAEYCEEIIEYIGKEYLRPSWYIIGLLEDERDEEIKVITAMFDSKQSSEIDILNSLQREFVSIDQRRQTLFFQAAENEQEEKTLSRKLRQCSEKKRTVVYVTLSIITLGIYSIFHSQKHMARIKHRLESTRETAATQKEKIASYDEQLSDIIQKIQACNSNIAKNDEQKQNEILSVNQAYAKRISLVEPLPSEISTVSRSEFIPLRTVCGMNDEKVVGCYVIRNRENGKCYVGQSKDVMKRICKQHFNGTKPNNAAFFEDYYSYMHQSNTSIEDLSDLFEVRIIPLDTKSDLDEIERELIETYDSFENGYNRTKGNV
ncbi:MAG: GIY-YIG nuclease family protein [Oscillospiraceae bacterium]|nr:GIY-YIG nuclease family protein [Oscillospiraceae bacterium]